MKYIISMLVATGAMFFLYFIKANLIHGLSEFLIGWLSCVAFVSTREILDFVNELK